MMESHALSFFANKARKHCSTPKELKNPHKAQKYIWAISKFCNLYPKVDMLPYGKKLKKKTESRMHASNIIFRLANDFGASALNLYCFTQEVDPNDSEMFIINKNKPEWKYACDCYSTVLDICFLSAKLLEGLTANLVLDASDLARGIEFKFSNTINNFNCCLDGDARYSERLQKAQTQLDFIKKVSDR
ncbi:hypothetical protein COU37_00965 [Candidatus Micrarchaeota archaeon CG10_big_fil_rev_8_21_14_0_10_45_29]|nr:MAG: hypothetical protein COU37_00965 [Candidatus Micrarchaeota archaeon CG10_big_fil_rev_8_21_14_0_10_45_29]